LILGTLSIFRTQTDIFPNINIPVVSIIGITRGCHRRRCQPDHHSSGAQLNDNGETTLSIIESQSLNGIAVIKVFFHPGVNISMAIAQIAGQSQTQLKEPSEE